MTSSAMSSQNVMCFQRKWHSLPLNEEFASLKIASHYTCITILVRKPHDLQARGDGLGAGSRATILTSTASDVEAPADDDRSWTPEPFEAPSPRTWWRQHGRGPWKHPLQEHSGGNIRGWKHMWTTVEAERQGRRSNIDGPSKHPRAQLRQAYDGAWDACYTRSPSIHRANTVARLEGARRRLDRTPCTLDRTPCAAARRPAAASRTSPGCVLLWWRGEVGGGDGGCAWTARAPTMATDAGHFFLAWRPIVMMDG
jgi:hypothetical protein